jgi:hypothetical protein
MVLEVLFFLKHTFKSFVLQILQGKRLQPLDIEITTKMFEIACNPIGF